MTGVVSDLASTVIPDEDVIDTFPLMARTVVDVVTGKLMLFNVLARDILPEFAVMDAPTDSACAVISIPELDLVVRDVVDDVVPELASCLNEPRVEPPAVPSETFLAELITTSIRGMFKLSPLKIISRSAVSVSMAVAVASSLVTRSPSKVISPEPVPAVPLFVVVIVTFVPLFSWALIVEFKIWPLEALDAGVQVVGVPEAQLLL